MPDSSKSSVEIYSIDCAHNQTHRTKPSPLSMTWSWLNMTWSWFSEPATVYMGPKAALPSSVLQETGYTPHPRAQTHR